MKTVNLKVDFESISDGVQRAVPAYKVLLWNVKPFI